MSNSTCTSLSNLDYARYLEATRFINEGLIRRDPDNIPSTRTRREWMESFLPALGHPEQSFPAIHIGGTAGKGSTSTMVAEILSAAGYRTGLHVSPYLQVAIEKLWLDGRFASVDEYCELMDWMRPLALANRGPEVPMHGMASVGLFLEFFRRNRVEAGVTEVGVGGRHDLTNVLRTEVAAVTNVGLDHEKTLGPTLEDIAHHKAGIIKPGCRAVVFAEASRHHALQACERQAAAVGVELRVVRDHHVRLRHDGGHTLRVDLFGENLTLHDVELGAHGSFQAKNAALALAICEEFDRSKGRLSEEAVRRGLRRARQPARFEWIASENAPCRVLLDGAHNPDKLQALLENLRLEEQGLVLVYGALASKSPGPAFAQLAQRARLVVLTSPRVYAKQGRPPTELARELDLPGEKVLVSPDAKQALKLALAHCEDDDLLLITGSLYLAGEVRDHFYPDREVLAQRRSWF